MLRICKKKKLKIDHAAFSTIESPLFAYKYPLDNYYDIENWLDYYSDNFFSKEKK